MKYLLTLFVIFWVNFGLTGQSFYFGNDLSYVNQMEDCGAVFKEENHPKDVYQIFADHGTNLIRVRLWVDPSWWQSPLVQPGGVKSFYNDLEDVKETIGRSKSAGMQVMLDLHLSDFWADPGRQLIPRAWLNVAYNLDALKDSVYNYTFNVLSVLNRAGLMPEIVKIGNENNSGILVHIPEENGYNPVETVSNSWSRHAQLYNSAIKAVRDVGAGASINPKIAVHFSNKLSGQVWNFTNLIKNGVTDFDIMGVSYYYAWHGASIGELESTIKSLVTRFPDYKVMVVETGYLWSTLNFDQMPNIVTEPDPGYLPVIPEKQLEYMIDYTRAVMGSGGTGVIFWEPAWVSTPCRTPWGQGTSHDHLVFFDPVNTNFMKNGGGRWTEPQYYNDIHAKKVIFKVDMTGQDVSNGVYITADFTGDPGQIIPMANEGNGIYSYFTYLPQGDSGAYFYLNENTPEAREILPVGCAGILNTDREYIINQSDNVFSDKWGTCSGNITGIRNMEYNDWDVNELTIYPNPSDGRLFLKYSSSSKRVQIEILDLSSKVVHFDSQENNSGQAEMHLPALADNLYILRFSDQKKVIYKKFLFNHSY
jgi:arabinogalactan endo-1,4-beta-galactosidase